MSKQTAVEWLAEQLDILLELYPSQWEEVNKSIEQAKEMEKQQIIDAFIGFDSDTYDNIEVARQYYNETFKK
tara:strand:- start:3891 stop:4106 length:216 start_codon:yes stop_codon:yes gene_type:complete